MINKNLDKQITMGNVANYVKKRELYYYKGKPEQNHVSQLAITFAALFFAFGIFIIPYFGHFLVLLTHNSSQQGDKSQLYFTTNDILATVLKYGMPFFSLAAGIVFVSIAFVMPFQQSKNKPYVLLKAGIIMEITTLLVTIGLYFTSTVFIPLSIGIFIKYIVILVVTCFIFVFGFYCVRQTKSNFYKLKYQSKAILLVEKRVELIWPLLGILVAISFATASYTNDIREAFYSATLPFFILLVIPLIYIIFRYFLSELIEYYYINKFPEAIRFETDFTKEEWYGKNYRKSKEVMRKIQEFEDYINNKEA